MQAFAAALASKTKENKNLTDTVDPVTQNGVVTKRQEERADLGDRKLKEAASEEHHKVEIPYDPSSLEQFENDPQEFCVLPKPIYILSDCTGESAARTVRAALGQFESSIRTHCPATLLMHRFVSTEKRILQIVEDASNEDALVVFTLVDPELVEIIQNSCAKHEVKCVDLWSHLLDIMEEHLDVIRSALPMNHPNRPSRRALDPDYEAVEYTRKMDDGAHPDRWYLADILLLGVSRSGKTPLSIFLGQRGYKVANLPLVKGCPIPEELYKIDQSKIFALTVDPHYLFKIRRSRMGSMGVSNGKSMYADLKGVIDELDYAHNLYKKNPIWPVLDVTNIGVEESAAKIQRVITDRDNKTERVMVA